MTNRNSVKYALLAATALAAAVPAAVYAAAPTETVAPVAHAADDVEAAAPGNLARNAGIAALATAFLAGLFGAKRIRAFLRRAAPVAAGAARAVAAAPVAAARAVGRAAASPFRFALIFGSLGVFALTGVGLYDVEWAGGLVAGALMAALIFGGAGQMRRAFAKARRTRIEARSEKFNQ